MILETVGISASVGYRIMPLVSSEKSNHADRDEDHTDHLASASHPSTYDDAV
jgi:hypothetical protein